ncbi:MAG: hypothetical protein L0191_16175, partial [Acidobacteria bacterium]|nr:hypothetical protein [Acidobacteriota bacterium]
AADAPPVKDVNQSDIIGIVGTTHDVMGNRWFRVVSGGIRGFVAAQDVAPPRSTEPEKGYEILRHSLMSLDNPEVLPDATQAVDLYRTSFPASAHHEELRWLLAERTRDFSKGNRSPELIGAARGIYEEIAGGKGEFADRARTALEELPTAVAPVERKRPSLARSNSGFNLVGGSKTGSLGSYTKPNGPVRRVTVVSKTPLVVRLTQPAQISDGAILYGEFARDVRVSQEVAVPQGSSAVIMVGQEGSGKKVASLNLTSATVRGEPYRISGYPLGMEIPGTGKLGPSRNIPSSLPAGTSIEFRLRSDLVITQR